MSKTQVYVDLDGVLADFFSEYAKLAGIKDGNYRSVPPAKNDPTLDLMIGTDFFARLPKFHSADQLIHIVVKVYGEYHICSSPLRGDHENCAKNKRIWIQNHLTPPPSTVIITPNKAKYAIQPDGTPNILIDDRTENIIKWNAAGGIGIKYQADEDSLQVVVSGLIRANRSIRNGSDKNTVGESVSSGDTSAGNIASFATTSNGANVGTLFGGTYKQPKSKKKVNILKR